MAGSFGNTLPGFTNTLLCPYLWIPIVVLPTERAQLEWTGTVRWGIRAGKSASLKHPEANKLHVPAVRSLKGTRQTESGWVKYDGPLHYGTMGTGHSTVTGAHTRALLAPGGAFVAVLF